MNEYSPTISDRSLNAQSGLGDGFATAQAVISHAHPHGVDYRTNQEHKIRLLNNIKTLWSNHLSKKSLPGAEMIDLGVRYISEAVERPWDTVLQQSDYASQPPPLPSSKIGDVLDKANGELLILGEPGSGKTTLLLRLAHDLIVNFRPKYNPPVPVVLNLLSWAEKRKPIASWLVEELNIRYQVPLQIGHEWVNNDELLLLLDGLDEVKPEYREECVKAINSFHQQHGLVDIVVCSRVEAYEALTTRLMLQDAITLQPPTLQQIDEYLRRAGDKLAGLQMVLKNDEALQKLAQLPPILNVMTTTYWGVSADSLQTPDYANKMRRRLLDTYVERAFEHRDSTQHYSLQQTIHSLAWQARKMLQLDQQIFFTGNIQPDWLGTEAERQLFNLSTALVNKLITGAALGTFVGMLIGLVVAISTALPGFEENVGTLAIIPISQLVGGLVFGLGAGLMAVLNVKKGEAKRKLAATDRETLTASFPILGIRQSIRNATGIGLVSALALGLASGLIFDMIGGPLLGITVGIISGLAGGGLAALFYGGKDCIRHIILRLILCRNKYIPCRYASFLEYASNIILLRKIGRGYSFVHPMLLDYFAGLDV